MDEEEKETLVEMLVSNSLSARVMESVTSSDEDESRDISTSERDQLADLKYNYAIQRLIVDYFNYDSMQVTVSDLQRSVMTALMDLRVEDGGLVEEFTEKMDVIKQDWGETPPCEFTIWFPWHVRLGDDPPMFEMYGHTFESADQSEWRPRLEEISHGPDVRGGKYILDEIEEGNYDVWKTTISSRTPRWAMLRFKNALEILSAQLNHSAYFMSYQTRANRLGRMSGDTRDGG